MAEQRHPSDLMIRVYRLPEKLSDGFCFGQGRPITFTNVDWFGSTSPDGFTPSRDELTAFIKGKVYYDPCARFLVLDDRAGETFVIERAVANG